MKEILKDLSSTIRRQSEEIEQLKKELAYYKQIFPGEKWERKNKPKWVK